MTMATETVQHQDSRKGAVLCKQSEIEEMDEHEPDTSPGSDHSDATITALERDVPSNADNDKNSEKLNDISKEISRAEVHVNEQSNTTNHIQMPQKVKQLQRSKAFEESPPPEQHTLYPQTNGLGQKSLSHDRLSKCGSQSSEAGSSCLSRDSSFDKSPYKDSTGINLEDFIHKTINKSPKDRSMLLKLETDLVNFVNEPKHHYLKFPPMSSYDRMLVHRIAAFFGLDHNVDQTGKSVIVNKTSNKRIPEFSFKEHIDNLDGDRKSGQIKVMKRGGFSLDERESYCKTLEKPSLANTKARSFEERKKQYDKVRSKIFNSCDEPMAYSEEEATIIIPNMIKKVQRPSSFSNSDGLPWSSTDSSGYGTDCSSKSRGIAKANSFGGVPQNHQGRTPLKSQSLCKTDSISSGTQSPSMAHLIAVPTPPGSRSDSSPQSRSSSAGPMQSPLNAGCMPGQNQQVLWVASSDYRNIPPGSVIINPQTGQPFTNTDGTIYTYNPNQPPPVTQQQPTMYAPPQLQPPTHQEVWPPNHDSSVGTEHLCRHLSAMNLNQQSSMESVGEPPGGIGIVQGPQYVIGSQTQPQVPPQGYQQANPAGQPQFFQSQNIAGQPNVRYVFPVNYQLAGQGQGSQIPVTPDHQNQTIPQSITQQFPSQYGPNYSHCGVSMPTAQSADNYSSFPSQPTYPIPHSDSIHTLQSSYPSPYSQSNFVQNPSQVFYSSVPGSQPLGYSYGTNQGPYQTGTTPPSQPPQPQSANISIQTVPGQQMGMAPSVMPSVQTPSTPQFNSVYPSMQQCQGQPQYRQSNPQIVQIPGVQNPHSVNLSTVGVNQTFPPVIRNMQVNVPLPAHVPHQSFIQQSGPVTVSAKGIPLDNQTPDGGGDNKEYILGGVGSYNAPVVAGPSVGQILRPQITTDLRLLGQPRGTLQQLQIHPSSLNQQNPRMVGNISKSQRLGKSRSKDGSECSSQSLDGDSPSTGLVTH